MQKATAIDNKERTRRGVYINDNFYKQVAKIAIDENVDNGAIIDRALEMYLKADQKN